MIQILLEAGVPAGVINFVPSDGKAFGDVTSKHPELAGVNFTGTEQSQSIFIADSLDDDEVTRLRLFQAPLVRSGPYGSKLHQT